MCTIYVHIIIKDLVMFKLVLKSVSLQLYVHAHTHTYTYTQIYTHTHLLCVYAQEHMCTPLYMCYMCVAVRGQLVLLLFFHHEDPEVQASTITY